MKQYLRFNDIPENEISNIYRGDSGKVGEEIGVSCIELNKLMQPIIPFKIKDGKLFYNKGLISFFNDFSWMMDDFISDKTTAYIIEGEHVGIGSDGEPLLKNINVVKKLNAVPTYKIKINKEVQQPNLNIAKDINESIIDDLRKIYFNYVGEIDINENIKNILTQIGNYK